MDGAPTVSRQSDRLIATLAIGAGAAAVLTMDHGRTPFDEAFAAAAAATGLPAPLLKAHARVESGFKSVRSKPNANGTADLGVMQINEATARALQLDPARLVAEPAYCITAAARLMVSIGRELGAQADVFHRIAAYNAGSPAIKRRGIFNVGYVSAVYWHFLLYTLAQPLKG